MGFSVRKMKRLYAMLVSRYTFFGLGVHAFNRLGPEEYIPNYQIICLKKTSDNALIKKRIPLFCLEEVMKKQPRKRNATSLLRVKKVRDYIKKHSTGKTPVLIVYKSSILMERICKKEGFLLAANPFSYTKPLFEHKLHFREILQLLAIPFPPYKVLSPDITNQEFFRITRKALGLPFLLQLAFKGGGKGNTLVYTAQEFAKRMEVIRKAYPQEKLGKGLFASTLLSGFSPSLTAVVTKFGIVQSPLQMQILDAKETLREHPLKFGLFCGHDFHVPFPLPVVRQAQLYAEKIGTYMRTRGYRGIFGLDFLWEERTNILYCLEINPRFLGTFPALFYEEIRQGLPPSLFFHLLEFLSLTEKEESLARKIVLDRKKNPMSLPHRKGSQVFLRNRLGREAVITRQLTPGIYRVVKNSLTLIKPDFTPLHLSRPDEFLICDGVPPQGAKAKKDERLLRIMFLTRILRKDKRTLTAKAKTIIDLVYKALALNPHTT